MKNNLLKCQLFLIGVFICCCKMSYAQISMEQRLEFNDDTLFVFNQNGKLGLGKDTNSVQFKYDSIRLDGDFNLVKENGKWGTISNENKIAIPLKYDELHEVPKRDLLIARKSNKWGVIDEDDQVLIPFKYDKIEGVLLSKDLFFVEKNGKWGLINEQNKLLLPFEYDSLGKGDNIKGKKEMYETILVKKNGKFGMVNDKNKILLPIIYDGILNRSEYGPNGYYVIKDGKKGFVSEEGKLLIPCIYNALNFNSDVKLFRLKQDNKYGVVSEYNEPFLPVVFNEIYLDVPMFYDETKDSAKIVVQDLDSAWHYLSVEDGSVLLANVPKDSVFKYYKTELFGVQLMEEYKQKVSEKEGGFVTALDTFHQQLVDQIIDSKSGVHIDFPDLHKIPINFIPDYRQTQTISKIRNYMLSRGYEVTMAAGWMDERSTGQELCFRVSLPDREILIGISLHKTFREEEYKIIESLKCMEQSKNYNRSRRFNNLNKD